MFGLKPEPEQGLTDEEAALLELISDRVHEEMVASGTDSIAADITEDVLDIVGAVADSMMGSGRKVMDERDFALIRQRVGRMVRKYQAAPQVVRRFALLDRVVCNVGGTRGWAAGSVQSLDEDDPSDVTGQTVLPYVVKMDPPNSRLISVPKDNNGVIRAEVCFGQRRGALWFTRMSLPKVIRKGSQRTRRFGVGDRVACAVEDATGDFSDWAAGTVAALDFPVEAEDGVEGGNAPYQVTLDNGASVLVHQDEHWLLRDLALQPAGPRIAADGTRCVKRMEKRAAGDAIEMVDHVTRKVRKMVPDSDDEDD